MKAVVMTTPGDPDVLELRDVPMPELRTDTDILVRLKAAGVNPIDTKLRARGTYYPERSNPILGCDGAGIIEAVGDQVTRFRIGDEVYFCNGGIGGHPGNYAEYAVLDEQFAAGKPAKLDFAHAAAAPLILITAWEALHDRVNIREGQDILIHAGAGGVGHVAIQLAKAAGCRVITTVSDSEKAALVKKLGADEVILYREQDLSEAVMAWTEGLGVDIAFDTVGGSTFVETFGAVRPYGKIVTLLQPADDTDWKLARLKNLAISLELMLSPMYCDWQDMQQRQSWILDQCAGLFDDGSLQLLLHASLPLADAAEAHRLIEAGGMLGKLSLTID